MEMVGDGCGVGERRLRPYGNPSHQASLKCPRCESVNTKFCYYNNYNLSQPRHFCKSCRRYWTKGGVLRNVPVGGGCRKNKRSKSKSTDEADGDSPRESKSRNKSSSSESSGLTAVAALATTTTMTPTSAEEGSAPGYTTSKASTVRDFSDSRIFDVNPRANRSYDRQPLENHPSTDGEIFAAEIGCFTNLMSSSEEAIGFGVVGDIPLTTSFDRAETVNQAAPAAAVVENPVQDTVADAFTMEDVNAGGLAAALGWGDGVDQGRFDLTAGVDPADWSQHQWTVNDQSLHYFPYI